MFQFLTVGFITGGLWSDSLVELAFYCNLFYFIGIMIDGYNHAEEDSYKLLKNLLIDRYPKRKFIFLERFSSVFLTTGIFLGGLWSGSPGTVLFLGYLLFLFGTAVLPGNKKGILFDHDLDMFLGTGYIAGVLWLRSYENLVFGGYIVYGIYHNFSVKPKRLSKLTLERPKMSRRPNITKENKGNSSTVDPSMQLQREDHNELRLRRSLEEHTNEPHTAKTLQQGSNTVSVTMKRPANQKKRPLSNDVSSNSNKSGQQISEELSSSSMSGRQHNDTNTAQSDDDPLRPSHSMNLSSSMVGAAGNSFQVAAGQNSNVNEASQIDMSEGSFHGKLADDDEFLYILGQHFDDRDAVDIVLKETKEALSAKEKEPDSQQRGNNAVRLGFSIDSHNSKLPAITIFQQDVAYLKGPDDQKSLNSANQIPETVSQKVTPKEVRETQQCYNDTESSSVESICSDAESVLACNSRVESHFSASRLPCHGSHNSEFSLSNSPPTNRVGGQQDICLPVSSNIQIRRHLIHKDSNHNSSSGDTCHTKGVTTQQDAITCNTHQTNVITTGQSLNVTVGNNTNVSGQQKVGGFKYRGDNMGIQINEDTLVDGPLIRKSSVHNSSAVYQYPIKGLVTQKDAGRYNYRQHNVIAIGQSLDFNIGGNKNDSGKQIIEGVEHEGVNMGLQIDGDFFSECSLICKGSGHSSSAGNWHLTKGVTSQDVARRWNAHSNNMLSTDQPLDVNIDGNNKNGSGQQKIGGVVYGGDNMAIQIHLDAFINGPLICNGLSHSSPADNRLYGDANASQNHVKRDGANVRIEIDGAVVCKGSSSLGSLVGYAHHEEGLELSQVDAKRYNIAQNNVIITNHSLDDLTGANINGSGVQIIGGVKYEGVNMSIQINGDVFTDGPLILQGSGHVNIGLDINGSGQQKIGGVRHGIVNVSIRIKGDLFVDDPLIRTCSLHSSSASLPHKNGLAVREAGRCNTVNSLNSTIGNNINGSGDQNIKGIKYGGDNMAMEINGCAFIDEPLIRKCTGHSSSACYWRYTEVLGSMQDATTPTRCTSTTHQKDVINFGHKSHNTNRSGHQEIKGVIYKGSNQKKRPLSNDVSSNSNKSGQQISEELSSSSMSGRQHNDTNTAQSDDDPLHPSHSMNLSSSMVGAAGNSFQVAAGTVM